MQWLGLASILLLLTSQIGHVATANGREAQPRRALDAQLWDQLRDSTIKVMACIRDVCSIWPEEPPSAIYFGGAMERLLAAVSEDGVEDDPVLQLVQSARFSRFNLHAKMTWLEAARSKLAHSEALTRLLEAAIKGLAFEISLTRIVRTLSDPSIRLDDEVGEESCETLEYLERTVARYYIAQGFQFLIRCVEGSEFRKLSRAALVARAALQEFESEMSSLKLFQLWGKKRPQDIAAIQVHVRALIIRALSQFCIYQENYREACDKASLDPNINLTRASLAKLWALDAQYPLFSPTELGIYVIHGLDATLSLQIAAVSLNTLLILDGVAWTARLVQSKAYREKKGGYSLLMAEQADCPSPDIGQVGVGLTDGFDCLKYERLLSEAPTCDTGSGAWPIIDPAHPALEDFERQLFEVALKAEELESNLGKLLLAQLWGLVTGPALPFLKACRIACRLLRGFLLYGKCANNRTGFLRALYHYSRALPYLAKLYTLYLRLTEYAPLLDLAPDFPYVWEILSTADGMASPCRDLAGFVQCILAVIQDLPPTQHRVPAVESTTHGVSYAVPSEVMNSHQRIGNNLSRGPAQAAYRPTDRNTERHQLPPECVVAPPRLCPRKRPHNEYAASDWGDDPSPSTTMALAAGQAEEYPAPSCLSKMGSDSDLGELEAFDEYFERNRPREGDLDPPPTFD